MTLAHGNTKNRVSGIRQMAARVKRRDRKATQDLAISVDVNLVFSTAEANLEREFPAGRFALAIVIDSLTRNNRYCESHRYSRAPSRRSKLTGTDTSI